MTIGERIKKARLEKGMTQKEVAEKCGINDANIRKYESGRQNPKLETIDKIAAAIGVNRSDILYDSYENNPKSKEEKEIEKIIENTIDDLEAANGLMFDGKPATEEDIEQIKSVMRIGLAMAKEKAREKFTPKKYNGRS